MPGLLTLKTDLKSLKYGQDQPGGGSSRQPYIVTDINTVDSGINRLRFTKFDDGLIRGGAVGAANAAIVDTLRIGKFFTDLPQGPLFIAKQVGLQLSNPRLESTTQPTNKPVSGQGFLTNVLNFVSNTANKIENAIGGPTRVYNLGINTLAQVPVNALGGHIMRHGLLPNNDESKLYYNVVTEKNFRNDTNRLTDLTNNFNLGSWGANKYGVTKKEQGFLNKLFGLLSPNISNPIASTILGGVTGIFNINKETEIDSYIGGPNSVYGIGTTTIRRYDDTEDKTKIDFAKNQSTVLAGKTRNNKGDVEDVDYTNDLGKSNNAISNYPGIPTDRNEIEQGIINVASLDPNTNYRSPALRTYANIVSQIAQQQDPENINNAFYSGSGGFAVGYVNQFGIYDTQKGDPNRVNKNSNYSTTDVGQIGYQNTYGDKVTINSTFNNWNKISRENRVGSFGKAKISGSSKELRAADSINLTPIFGSNMTADLKDSKGNPILDKNGNIIKQKYGDKYWMGDSVVIDGVEHNIRDLVKFRISSILTDSPDVVNTMVFRAYLTSFSDSVDSQWTDIKYAGRGNPFYIYNGFNRKIQIGFKVAALSAEEMQPIYSKLNYLMSNLMPDYSNNLMRGPLVRMTVGNYLDAQFGKLDSLSYTVPNDSPWEIALDEPEGGSKQLILPHILEVSLNFTPMGAETQGKNKIEDKNRTTTFLAQNNTGGDKDTIQYYDYFTNKFD